VLAIAHRQREDLVNKKVACGLVLMLSTTVASYGQAFKVLLDFDGTNGADPFYMSLVQGLDGSFYGTASAGGPHHNGTVFKVTAAGALTTLYDLCPQVSCIHGSGLDSGVVLAADGNFYGFANNGGLYNFGAVYRITSSGQWTTLHSFNGSDGAGQYYSALIQGTDGKLYGVTTGGGTYGYGTAFSITLSGTLTTLYNFCSQPDCADGGSPVGGLVQGADGSFYGATLAGGANGYGTLFKITRGGTLTTLYNFCSQPNCADGYYPHAALVRGGDGNFYGTTGGGTAGTMFRMAPDGTFTTLLTFCCDDGGSPVSGLIEGTDGSFYGTTASPAGSSMYGALYRITRDGRLTILHSFDGTDGSTPYGGLVQGTDGSFYGTTTYGGPASGTLGYGTVYRLSVGLAPFVTSLPNNGAVGETIKILGTDLIGATAVNFNGVPAAFTVVSPTEVATTVPTDATTGYLTVATPTGTLKTNVPFQVLP